MHTKTKTGYPAFEEGKNVKIAPALRTKKQNHSKMQKMKKKQPKPQKNAFIQTNSGGPQAIPSRPFQIHIYVRLRIFF